MSRTDRIVTKVLFTVLPRILLGAVICLLVVAVVAVWMIVYSTSDHPNDRSDIDEARSHDLARSGEDLGEGPDGCWGGAYVDPVDVHDAVDWWTFEDDGEPGFASAWGAVDIEHNGWVAWKLDVSGGTLTSLGDARVTANASTDFTFEIPINPEAVEAVKVATAGSDREGHPRIMFGIVRTYSGATFFFDHCAESNFRYVYGDDGEPMRTLTDNEVWAWPTFTAEQLDSLYPQPERLWVWGDQMDGMEDWEPSTHEVWWFPEEEVRTSLQFEVIPTVIGDPPPLDEEGGWWVATTTPMAGLPDHGNQVFDEDFPVYGAQHRFDHQHFVGVAKPGDPIIFIVVNSNWALEPWVILEVVGVPEDLRVRRQYEIHVTVDYTRLNPPPVAADANGVALPGYPTVTIDDLWVNPTLPHFAWGVEYHAEYSPFPWYEIDDDAVVTWDESPLSTVPAEADALP